MYMNFNPNIKESVLTWTNTKRLIQVTPCNNITSRNLSTFAFNNLSSWKDHLPFFFLNPELKELIIIYYIQGQTNKKTNLQIYSSEIVIQK